MAKAVELVQAKLGLTVDGDFGPKTARALVAHFNLSKLEGAHWIGQMAVESGGFTTFEENLRYSAKRLCAIWPKRFPTIESALPYAWDSSDPDREDVALANLVYGDRMGNERDGTSDNDGWDNRGRGPIQITGEDNYKALEMAYPKLVNNRDLVATDYAFESAHWYFGYRKIWPLCAGGVNQDTVKRITLLVNGGYHGLEERTAWTVKASGWLS